MANSETKTQIAEEGAEMIRVGHVYKEDGTDREVSPFFVDLPNSQVRFAPIGSGREDMMRTSDFLGRFKYQGEFSSRAENQTAANTRPSESEDATRRVSRDAGAVTTEADDKNNLTKAATTRKTR